MLLNPYQESRAQDLQDTKLLLVSQHDWLSQLRSTCYHFVLLKKVAKSALGFYPGRVLVVYESNFVVSGPLSSFLRRERL